jgi:hypothetical protein
MHFTLLNVASWLFSLFFMAVWFWKGMNAAFWLLVAITLVVVSIAFLGGPQFIGGILTGVLANDLYMRYSVRRSSKR